MGGRGQSSMTSRMSAGDREFLAGLDPEERDMVRTVMSDTGMGARDSWSAVLSIGEYTAGDYRKIIDSQRAGRDDGHARTIEDLIDRSEKWGDAMVTYRGMNVSAAEYARYTTVGETLEPRALQSWTTNGGMALSFSRAWQGGHPIILRSPTQNRGIGIKHLSLKEDEDEVLAGKRARYRVKSYTEDYDGLGVTVIDVEEV